MFASTVSVHTRQAVTEIVIFFTFSLEYIYSRVLFGDPLHDNSGKDKAIFIPWFPG